MRKFNLKSPQEFDATTEMPAVTTEEMDFFIRYRLKFGASVTDGKLVSVPEARDRHGHGRVDAMDAISECQSQNAIPS